MDKTPTEWMIEPLRRYAQFSGRSRRAEFWWFTLFGLIVALIAFLLDSLLGLRPARGGTGLIGGLCLARPVVFRNWRFSFGACTISAARRGGSWGQRFSA